jgi:fructose-specific phosphotransferase system IIC component
MSYESRDAIRRKSFLGRTAERAEGYLRSYGGLTTAIGFSIAAPIGFTAGFAGSFLSDAGRFAYDSLLYLANNFPACNYSGLFSHVVDYLYSSFTNALVTGLKDGFVSGIGGIVVSRWIKRKLIGETSDV